VIMSSLNDGGLGSPGGSSSVNVSQISDASANGRSLISAADFAAMRGSSLLAQGRTLISTTSITGVTNQNIPSVFSALYDNYEIIITSVGSAAADLRMQLSIAGTATAGGAYYAAGERRNLNDTIVSCAALGVDYWTLGRIDSAGVTGLFTMTLAKPFLTTIKATTLKAVCGADSNVYKYDWGGTLSTATSHDGIRLSASTGNITTCTVKIYGLN